MQKSVAYFDKYEQIDCNLYYNRFGNNSQQPTEDELKDQYLNGKKVLPKINHETGEHVYTRMDFQKEAYQAWENFYNPDSEAKKDLVVNYVNGTLGCFCSEEYKKKSVAAIFNSYRKDGLDQLPPYILKQVDAKEYDEDEYIES